jgi:hypothetical protein
MSITALITMAAAAGVAGVGYVQTRGFVSRRLRYVDQAQSPAAPVLAGIAAAVIAMPVVAFIPFIGAGTAVLFGIAVGLGPRAGVRTFGRALSP